ncbi:MAG: YdcF family protein [Anaerolineae bacterium]|nr:YdcF family protein [Anaerolineae bacterium]
MTNQESIPLWGRSQAGGDLVLVDRRLYAIRRRRPRLWLGLAGLLLIVTGLLVVGRAVWLQALGDFLVYRQAPHAADAIIVLGGGSGERSALGAALYREGYAPLVITSRLKEDELCPGAAPAARLARAGVPAGAVRILENPRSTYHEVLMARALLQELGARDVLLVTDTFHSRRAYTIFSEMLADIGVTITSVPAEPEWFKLDAWWHDEDSLRSVFNEYAKFIWFYIGQRASMPMVEEQPS